MEIYVRGVSSEYILRRTSLADILLTARKSKGIQDKSIAAGASELCWDRVLGEVTVEAVRLFVSL